jgi:ferredoxin, 2Fe-2S
MPIGVDLDVDDGDTVFHAAVEAGFRWPTVCGGEGTCRTCYMSVVAGLESFAEPDDWEQEGLEDLPSSPVSPLRLACQARVHGDAVVRKPGVKRRSAH